MTSSTLATRLEAWALRREKVIFVLDRANAKLARELSARCRTLIAAEGDIESNPELRSSWQTIKQEATALLLASGHTA